MNLDDMLTRLFGEEGSAILFDAASDAEIEVESSNADVSEWQKPRLDLTKNDKAFAVASMQHDLSKAMYIFSKGEDKIGVYALDPEVAIDSIIEEFILDVPLDWKWSEGDGDYITKEELNAIPVRDDVDDETDSNGVDGAVESGDVDDTFQINAAVVVGDATPEMNAFLDQKAVFMAGQLYDQGDHRNTQKGGWKRNEWDWRTLIYHDKHGLTCHPEAKTKHGGAIVLGETLDGQRNAESVKSLSAVVIDIDSGPNVDQVTAKLLEHGLLAVVYTSFNHNKTEVVLKHDDILRKLKISETPTRPQVQEYLRAHSKERYDEAFIQKVEIVDARRQTADGLRVVLKTPPLEKFRVVVPLAEPVELADLAPTVQKWKDVWADKVTGFVLNVLGVSFDSTSCDVNRLFYTPRHKKGAEFRSILIQGNPLRYEDIKPSSKDAYVRDRSGGASDNPFLHGDTQADNEPPQCHTPGGEIINLWHRKAKDRFLLPQLIEAEAPERVRRHVSEGKIEIECPFEDQHSKEGGTGTVCMDPQTNEQEVWTASCPHDSCQGRHKFEFLEEMLKQGWFSEDHMKDDSEFMLPSNEPDVPTEEEKIEERKKKTFLDEAKELGEDPSEGDISRVFRRMVKLSADTVETAKVYDHLSKNTPLTRAELKGLMKRVAAEVKIAAAKDDNSLEGFDSTPDVTKWGFGDQCEYARRRISAENAKRPRIFHYMEELARIDDNADGRHRISMLSERQFGAELNTITKWKRPIGEDSMLEIAAPNDVVSQIFNARRVGFPPLRGLATSPIFVKTGEMLSTPGYNTTSGLYYAPDMTLDIPPVPESPSAEEVHESKRLLIEEVLADFPLGGYTRDEIVKIGLNGAGIPAVANCIGLLILLFCRDMVEGPTPGHLITKPSPGTGASLLTDVISSIGNGAPTPAATLPGNPDEMSKTLITYMADGQNMIYFDNINRNVDSGELASAMTAPTYRARLLGKSQTIETEVRCAWVFTGNNVQLSNELIRRLTMIDLDAKLENPEKRGGFRHEDIMRWIRENRGQLVWACLTLIQNWISKDKPLQTAEILNSYENWSKVIGGILQAAGIGGFMRNRKHLRDISAMDDTDDILPLVNEWWEHYADKHVVIKQTNEMPSLLQLVSGSDVQLPIRQRRSPDGDSVYDMGAFTKMLKQHRGRVIRLSSGDTVRIDQDDALKSKHGVVWKLEKMDGA